MAINMDDIRAIQQTNGVKTRRDALIRATKLNLTRELTGSLHYESEAKRNGVTQPLVVTTSNVNDECDVFSMPDEQILVGDTIDCFGQKWIIIEVSPVNTLQLRGKMKLCNHLFKFQDFDGRIFERWGVLDPGVYSTTQRTSNYLVVTDAQYKVYLPYDDDTSMLYEDKRFSTGVAYDNEGNKILRVFRITRIDDTSESWGEGKLLVAYVRSDAYNPDADNLELQICDYIDPEVGEDPDAEGSWF